jgi:hypothetical protein
MVTAAVVYASAVAPRGQPNSRESGLRKTERLDSAPRFSAIRTVPTASNTQA